MKKVENNAVETSSKIIVVIRFVHNRLNSIGKLSKKSEKRFEIEVVVASTILPLRK